MYNEELLDALFNQPEPDWKVVRSFCINQQTALEIAQLIWLEAHAPEKFEEIVCGK